jgi:arsenite methyltransferase
MYAPKSIKSEEVSMASSFQADLVKEYYGKVLASKNDLKTTACCVADSPDPYLKNLLKKIHPEVSEKFYGCGLPISAALEGTTVLDLGAGSGRDCFVLSPLVGSKGRVIGIDMTHEQIAVARKHQSFHADVFGPDVAAVEFKHGYIEDLLAAGIADSSVDLVVSNCVINLSPDKDRVFEEIFRVLKPGGELYFSDVYADRRLPKSFMEDQVLLGECLGGALYTEDLRRLLNKHGCKDPRFTSKAEIAITNPDVKNKTGLSRFFSITTRAFKLDLEDKCEDYGQVATYLGSISEFPHNFILDDHHNFVAGKPMLVCSNTAAMLNQTRFAKHFSVKGDLSQHFGIFDCAPAGAATNPTATGGACC